MKKFKLILPALLTIVTSGALIAGSTYALFTSNTETNIAVTSGKVKLKAYVDSTSLSLYSPKVIDSDTCEITDSSNVASETNFGFGGTASISQNGDLTLTNMIPGDKATFNIKIDNTSNVNIKYKVTYEDITSYSGNEDYKLIDALTIKANDNLSVADDVIIDWTEVAANTAIDDISLSVELPCACSNDYQDLSSSLRFKVEAVQANAYTENATNYLTFTANGDVYIKIPQFVTGENFQYSLDGGESWIDRNATEEYNYVPLNNGKTLKLRGTNCTTSSNINDGCKNFEIYPDTTNDSVSLSGSVTSLTDRKGVDPNVELTSWCYAGMFRGCDLITSAPELPALELETGCYAAMFSNCTSMNSAPDLPAENLKPQCYYEMFLSCTSLSAAPKISAKTMDYQSCSYMFADCRNLVTAPVLSSTQLSYCCYDNMFNGCEKLAQAPELPAKIMAPFCYQSMFEGCIALTELPALPATELAIYCYSFMFQSCTGLTSISKNYLPLTSLKANCYQYMFGSCTNLVSIPNLPATELVDSCYYNMFVYCSSLQVKTTGDNDKMIFTCPTLDSLTDPVTNMFFDINEYSEFEGTPSAGNTYYWYIQDAQV